VCRLMRAIIYFVLDVDYSSPLPPGFNQRMHFVALFVYRYSNTICCYCNNVKHRWLS